jgi:hypothetical protein
MFVDTCLRGLLDLCLCLKNVSKTHRILAQVPEGPGPLGDQYLSALPPCLSRPPRHISHNSIPPPTKPADKQPFPPPLASPPGLGRGGVGRGGVWGRGGQVHHNTLRVTRRQNDKKLYTVHPVLYSLSPSGLSLLSLIKPLSSVSFFTRSSNFFFLQFHSLFSLSLLPSLSLSLFLSYPFYILLISLQWMGWSLDVSLSLSRSLVL